MKRLVFLLCALLGLPAGAHASSGSGDYHPHTLLVGFEGGGPASRADVHARMGSTLLNRFEDLDIDVVRLPDLMDPPFAATRYAREPGVRFAEPNRYRHLDSVPDDTHFSKLWGLHNTGQAESDWILETVLLPGVYYVTANAHDAAGNVSNSVRITLVVV